MAVEDREFLAALDRLDEMEHPSRALAAVAISPSDICRTYQQLKPIIDTVLRYLERIPVFGKKVADLIRRLEALLDMVCSLAGGGANAAGARGGRS